MLSVYIILTVYPAGEHYKLLLDLLGGSTASLTELVLVLVVSLTPATEDSLVKLVRDGLDDVEEEGGAREFPWVEEVGEANATSDWECRTVVVWWGRSPGSSYETRRVVATVDWTGVYVNCWLGRGRRGSMKVVSSCSWSMKKI